MTDHKGVKIHLSADVSPEAQIGPGTTIWNQAQVRDGSQIGTGCILSKGVYVDTGVVIGNNVKIQNYVSIYHGVTLEDGVMCGPHSVFTNDKLPRAINLDGSLKSEKDWSITRTLVRRGAAIGANATIVCGVTIGQWAMIGAGAVVTADLPDYGLAFGNPARLRGFVCACGARFLEGQSAGPKVIAQCSNCGYEVELDRTLWEQVRKI